MSDEASTPRSLARFADGLLGSDLPALDAERRRAAVSFIGRRVRVLPSVTRAGVLTIAAVVEILGVMAGHDRVRRVVVAAPLPLLSEYPRLVRSLGYAYIWENWPHTAVDGGAAS
jgi:hypothetical protein